MGVLIDDPRQANMRFKARTYNLGISVGKKIENFPDKFFLDAHLIFQLPLKKSICR